jgi:hypothetical protein
MTVKNSSCDLSTLSYELLLSPATLIQKDEEMSPSLEVEINLSSVQYQGVEESLRFRFMKARDHAPFPGPGFDISFWFALFSPLVGLMTGLIFAWLFTSLAQ